MGIKQTLTSSQLPSRYQNHTLRATSDGVTATVYLLDNDYVLKLFELGTPISVIENEMTLLEQLSDLAVPKVIEHFSIKEHEVVVYSQIQGESMAQPSKTEIEQIGLFLKAFHQRSCTLESRNEQIFSVDKLQELIEKTQNKTLQNYFSQINLTLNNDGIIHGDLFVDNCKFLKGTLSGVYDFAEACVGDFYFELAVVVVGWCFEGDKLNQSKVNILLQSYQAEIPYDAFEVYIQYALLYYATTRYLGKRDYPALLRRLEHLL